MRTNNILKSERRTYIKPQIERVIIDNEISLQLSSAFNPIDIGDPGDGCDNYNIDKSWDNPYE